jgi:DNA-binding NtrC family response regulator
MKTILILDDDDAVRESLVDFFEDREWRVVSAASAEAALEMLTVEKPDGAVVDIRLPGMDGNAFILAAVEKRPAMAYVIVTGSPEYSLPGDVAGLSGVSHLVFSKPIADLPALEKALLDQIKKNNLN